VCFIPLGFSIKASNLVPYTMQKRMVWQYILLNTLIHKL
jgi:hypothetical protein